MYRTQTLESCKAAVNKRPLSILLVYRYYIIDIYACIMCISYLRSYAYLTPPKVWNSTPLEGLACLGLIHIIWYHINIYIYMYNYMYQKSNLIKLVWTTHECFTGGQVSQEEVLRSAQFDLLRSGAQRADTAYCKNSCTRAALHFRCSVWGA